jgi:tRNA-2-methylthio-N6-dimethylallyladenosine synthase
VRLTKAPPLPITVAGKDPFRAKASGPDGSHLSHSPEAISGSRPRAAKKLFIKTYGCQMNVYDSARMADALLPHGYAATETVEDADLVILNTCHIREKAAEKVYSDLGRLRRLKEHRAEGGGELMIGVAGCVAQAEGLAMLERAPFVDIVVGPQTYHRLPELVHRRARESGGVIDTDFPIESKFDLLPEERAAAPGVSTFLSVQEGCDRFCTFCVVPYTRGAETSRPAAAVLAEARHLVRAGAREITLLGQNVNAWHGQGLDRRIWSLARLIAALAEIPDLERIRYTTSHPRDMAGDLIEAHGRIGKLMPFLHLPVQSGSDGILQAMNRRHRAEDFIRLVERLRLARPDLALSSDFIVGFPGESDADFQATLDLVETVGFAQAFSFKYSPRPGTPAAGMRRQVPEPVKAARLGALQERLDAQAQAFNAATLGRTLPVLLERAGRHPGQLAGRSPYLQAVHVAGDEAAIGQVIDVVITAQHPHSLSGTPIGGVPSTPRARQGQACV